MQEISIFVILKATSTDRQTRRLHIFKTFCIYLASDNTLIILVFPTKWPLKPEPTNSALGLPVVSEDVVIKQNMITASWIKMKSAPVIFLFHFSLPFWLENWRSREMARSVYWKLDKRVVYQNRARHFLHAHSKCKITYQEIPTKKVYYLLILFSCQ